MKEKRIVIILVLVALCMMLLFAVSRCEVTVVNSPDGEHQVVGIIVDKGGWGYGGNYYVKEKGLFSSWSKLCPVPAAIEWISDNEIEIDQASPIDGDWKNNHKTNHEWIYTVK